MTHPRRRKNRSKKAENPGTPKPARTKSAKTRANQRVADFQGSDRLQKVLASAGLGSRRGLEKQIEAGQIQVNGKKAALGATVTQGDQILIDGRRLEVIAAEAPSQTLIYHKPEGEVTTRSDPEGRRTVFDRLPQPEQGRWIAIGRLDLNTAGLLLLTTDGELANRMMHPSGQVDREYLCRIRGEVSNEQIQNLLRGVQLEDGMAKFSDLVIGESTSGHTWYTVTIMEGRNREVRRLWDAVGAQVARLKRVRFGPVFIPARLRTGQYERLSDKDHRILREDVGLKPRSVTLTAAASRKRQ
ncbi:MAG: pseudouridine synthase [Pseudomonadota bacterium]